MLCPFVLLQNSVYSTNITLIHSDNIFLLLLLLLLFVLKEWVYSVSTKRLISQQ